MDEQLLDGFLTVNGLRVVGVTEALKLISLGATLVDVREPYLTAYKKFNVASVSFVPLSQLEVMIHQLPKDRILILADSSGNQVREAGRRIEAETVCVFVVLGGGMVDWERNGGPVLIDKAEELTGSCICQMRKPKSI